MTRYTFLSLLAKIKCSIYSYQFNIWYAGHLPTYYLFTKKKKTRYNHYQFLASDFILSMLVHMCNLWTYIAFQLFMSNIYFSAMQ